MEKIKKIIWKFIYKFFIKLQKFVLKFKLMHHRGKGKYHIGWLKDDKTLEELKSHLSSKWNFGNNFVAWVDDGQVLSWRKLTDFNHQYHLRVYCDGEIRGHFEYTPEGHPITHYKKKGEIEVRSDLLKFLGDFVSHKRGKIHLEIDPDAFNSKSEITIDQIKKNNHK